MNGRKHGWGDECSVFRLKKHYASACLPSSVSETNSVRTCLVMCELDGIAHDTWGLEACWLLLLLLLFLGIIPEDNHPFEENILRFCIKLKDSRGLQLTS